MDSWYAVFIALLLIGVFGGLLYSHTLDAPFVFDDKNVIEARVPTRYANYTLGHAFSGTRSLTYYTYGLNYRWDELQPRGYHIVNITLHIASGMVVFWLTWQLLRLGTKEKRIRFGDYQMSNHYLAALAAALLFVVHPLQTEGVTYVTARAGLLAALFYFVSLVAYVGWRSGKRWWWILVALIAAAMAMYSKETAYTLPLAVGVLELLYFRSRWKAGSARIAVVLVLLALVAVPAYKLGGRVIPQSVHEAYSGDVITAGAFVVTQNVVKAQYLRLLAAPYGQSVDHEVALVESVTDSRFVGSTLLLLALLAAAAWLIVRQQQLAAFGIFFFFIALLPESSIYPLPELMVEYRLYLPMLGLVLVAASGVQWLLNRDKRAVAITLCIAIVLTAAIATYHRNALWRDPAQLWANAAERVTHKARPYVNQATVLIDRGDYGEAEAPLLAAQEVDSDHPLVYHNLGALYRNSGQIKQAIAAYERAIELWPENALAHFNLGMIYVALEDWELAVRHLERSVELDLVSAKPVVEQVRNHVP